MNPDAPVIRMPDVAVWQRTGGALRTAAGLAVLGVVIWRIGADPFWRGARAIGPASIATAVAVTAGTTVCAAWRWRLVARGLGTEVPLPRAVLAYYRAQLLNSVLPGGVLGDVHRGVRHGLRPVIWERVAGQVIQLMLALLVLAVLPSPVRIPMSVVVAVAALIALGVAAGRRSGVSPAGALAGIRRDLRAGLLANPAWPGIVALSAVVVAGHVAVFLVAARAAGAGASLSTLVPLAMLAMVAMSVPLNVAGWGPREGVAAWAFGSAGLGAQQGVAVAAAYGVLSLVAIAPAALLLLHRPVVVRTANRGQAELVEAGAGHG